MNIVMVSYMDLTGPGVMHLYHFANELSRQAHAVLVLLNGDLDSVELMEQPPHFDLEQVRFTETDLEPSLVRKIKDFEPDLVHAWTSRNVPAHAGLSVKYHTGAKLLIHYEDDEDYLYNFHHGNLLGDLAFFVDTLRNPDIWAWKQPVVSFLANHFADAFTAICRPYLGRLERQWGKKAFLLYPGVDLNRFHPSVKPVELGSDLDLAGQEVVLYSGSIAAFHQFDLLLQAFTLVARRRPNVVLVHLGHNRIQEALDAQVRHLGLEDQVHFLGPVPHRDIHRYLALADVLVQSGRPNTFNEFRLPSKLPEYMAMGKPVITFSAGIGREFEDGVEALKTTTGEPPELAEKIEQVLDDPALTDKLGRGARRKAEQLFDWQRNTQGLITIYEQVLTGEIDAPMKPRLRPSITQEVFGPWWEVRDSRHVLVVAHAADGELVARTQGLVAALASCGHRVDVAVPENANLSIGIDQLEIHTWAPESLNLLMWDVDPEILLFTHWSALLALDELTRRPIVLDLAGGWSEPNASPGKTLHTLAKADFLLCNSEEQRRDFLSWADHHRLTIPINDTAVIPLCSQGEASAKELSDLGANGSLHSHLETVIEPLDQFCRAPFIREPPRPVPAKQKTIGTLIDEAIRHYRRGGALVMARETVGYFRRKLRG